MTDDELLALARNARGRAAWEHEFNNFLHAITPATIIAMIERHRAEVEELKADVAHWKWHADEYQERTEAAESALAAAQKRVGEARDCLDLAECQCPDYTPFGPECGVCKARAALAGKEPGAA